MTEFTFAITERQSNHVGKYLHFFIEVLYTSDTLNIDQVERQRLKEHYSHSHSPCPHSQGRLLGVKGHQPRCFHCQ